MSEKSGIMILSRQGKATMEIDHMAVRTMKSEKPCIRLVTIMTSLVRNQYIPAVTRPVQIENTHLGTKVTIRISSMLARRPLSVSRTSTQVSMKAEKLNE